VRRLWRLRSALLRHDLRRALHLPTHPDGRTLHVS
jgi:hypothetical protein